MLHRLSSSRFYRAHMFQVPQTVLVSLFETEAGYRPFRANGVTRFLPFPAAADSCVTSTGAELPFARALQLVCCSNPHRTRSHSAVPSSVCSFFYEKWQVLYLCMQKRKQGSYSQSARADAKQVSVLGRDAACFLLAGRRTMAGGHLLRQRPNHSCSNLPRHAIHSNMVGTVRCTLDRIDSHRPGKWHLIPRLCALRFRARAGALSREKFSLACCKIHWPIDVKVTRKVRIPSPSGYTSRRPP
jgi:hypothetical protein